MFIRILPVRNFAQFLQRFSEPGRGGSGIALQYASLVEVHMGGKHMAFFGNGYKALGQGGQFILSILDSTFVKLVTLYCRPGALCPLCQRTGYPGSRVLCKL